MCVCVGGGGGGDGRQSVWDKTIEGEFKVMVKCLSVLEMTKENPNTNTIMTDK